MNKIREFLINKRWSYISIITIINLSFYLYNLLSYQQLTEYINYHNHVTLKFVLLSFFIKMIFTHLVEKMSRFLLERQVVHIVRGIFKNLIIRIVNFKLPYIKQISTNKLNQLWFYLNSVEYIITKLIIDVPRVVLFVSYYTYIIYNFSFLALCLIIPTNILLVYIQQPLINKQYECQEERTALDLLSKNRFLETMLNIDYVKLKNQQNYEIQKIMTSYDKYIDNVITDTRLTHYLSYISMIGNDFVMTLIYMIGIGMITDGNLTASELLFLGIHTNSFYYRLKELKDIYNHYNRNQSRIHTIYELLTINELESQESNKRSSVTEKLNNQDICFRNVTFGYNENEQLLNNLNLDFKSNKINLLIGPNGSGKSTVIKLLLGLYELPDDSMIEIGNQNIKNLSKEFIRSKICFVSQDPYIFDDTVLNNVNYGIYNKKVQESILTDSNLLDLKNWLIENKDKKCGFGGKNLSGGEKKKIQLLNSIYSESDIIIFDEPSNTLDKLSLQWFKDLTIKLRDQLNKTIIIITHDTRLKDLSDITINMSGPD
jgi:ABC-type bacteriocin/lantibiotic exporter with double-glycine peptidase domain